MTVCMCIYIFTCVHGEIHMYSYINTHTQSETEIDRTTNSSVGIIVIRASILSAAS